MKRLIAIAVSLIALGAGLASVGVARAQEGGRYAAVMEVDDTIKPVVAKFVGRALREAREDGASVVVIELDTPGGLIGATRDIVQKIMQSGVPVVVYVTPSGAEATSAGVFITASAHVAGIEHRRGDQGR